MARDVGTTHATRLAAALEKAEMSGAQLARELGVGEAHVSKWRRGRSTPSRTNQLRIAKALDLPVLALWPDHYGYEDD